MTVSENDVLTKRWLKTVGKDKVQSLQDMLANVFNVSICLLDMNGKALTVRSKPLLICYYIRKSKGEFCKQEFLRAIEKCKKEGQPSNHECYFGLRYFMCPVFSAGKMVAIMHCGGFYENENQLPDNLKPHFDVPVMLDIQAQNVYKLLSKIIEVMDVNLSLGKQTQEVDEIATNSEYAVFEEKLSSREYEVAVLASGGCSNKVIADKLCISEKTVKTHISNILSKLEVKDRMQIMLLARK